MKRYLFEVGHPAHVHYFKNMAKDFVAKGDKVLFVCNKRAMIKELLEHEGLDYIQTGKHYHGMVGKAWSVIYRIMRLLWISIWFHPDVLINASVTTAFVAWLLRKPHFAIEDTYNMEQARLYLPFTSCVLTGDYEHPSMGPREVKYAGYQELMYLHPNRFTSNPRIVSELTGGGSM